MSEPAPEPSPGGRGNPLTARLGPFPVWAYLVAITVAGLAYYLYEKHKASSSTSTAADVGTTMTGAAGIPDYVSQVTVNNTEPATSPPVSAPPPTTTTPTTKKTTTPAKKTTTSSAQPPIMNATYTVKPGDTLASLSEKFGFGTDRAPLAHANGLGTGAGLRTGQVLHVPSPAPGGTPNKAE